jgi:hypothetical protein
MAPAAVAALREQAAKSHRIGGPSGDFATDELLRLARHCAIASLAAAIRCRRQGAKRPMKRD